MLRGYRVTGIAALLAAWPLSAQQDCDACSGQSGSEQSSHIAQDAPRPIAPAIDRIANELAKTRDDQKDAYGDERNQREKRDIIAQERSAHWAQANFWAIIVQTLLAGGALVAILYDIKQNRKSSEAQLRAYLTFDEFIWDIDQGDYKLQLKWVNGGQTPAHNANGYVEWIALDVPLGADFAFPEPPQRIEDGPTSVGIGKKFFATSDRDMMHTVISMAMHKTKHVYVWGRADYTDAFGVERFCNVAIKMVVEQLSEAKLVIRWVSLPKHNDAN